MTRVGVALPTYGAFPGDSWEFFRTLAELAEEGGLDELWLPDHLTLPPEDVMAAGGTTRIEEPLDAWTVLAAIAARTSRLRLGSVVTPLPLRRLVPFAQTVSTLDALSGGRVVLGLGAGSYRDEFEEAGVPFRPHARRMEQFREGVDLLLSLLEGQPVWWEGDYYAPQGASVRTWRDEGRLPVWFGGSSYEMLEMTAELADGWVAPFNSPPEEVERAREHLRERLDISGRDAGGFELAVPLVCRVAKTRKKARADVEAYAERGWFGSLEEVPGDRRHAVFGSAEAVAAQIEPYLELGVDHLILDVRPPDLARDSLERICADLLPLLRVG